jgi:tRNA 2-thiouridine synthesizing protein A
METKSIDARGLKCPQPTLKVMAESHGMAKGDIIEVIADCATFEQDMRNWCQRAKKSLLWIRQEGDSQRCQVRL